MQNDLENIMINMNEELLEYKKYQKNLNLAKFKCHIYNGHYMIKSILINNNELKKFQKTKLLPLYNKCHDYNINDFAIIRYFNDKIIEESSYDNGNLIFKKSYYENIMQISYFNNNEFHRIDGPAIIRYNKNNKIMSKYFYFNGVWIKSVKSLKQFKKYLKLQSIQ